MNSIFGLCRGWQMGKWQLGYYAAVFGRGPRGTADLRGGTRNGPKELENGTIPEETMRWCFGRIALWACL
jgi:hypothetical protein